MEREFSAGAVVLRKLRGEWHVAAIEPRGRYGEKSGAQMHHRINRRVCPQTEYRRSRLRQNYPDDEPNRAAAELPAAHDVADLRDLATGDLDAGELGAPAEPDADLVAYLDRQLPPLPTGVDAPPQHTLGFQRVLQRAAAHVQSAGKDEVDGRDVLVAIFREPDSHAAYLLGRQGITRLDVTSYLSHGVRKVPAPTMTASTTVRRA